MTLLFDISDSVATITFNRPERRNAINGEMRALLADSLQRVARDPDVRALVLTGAGGAFCAGGDFDGLRALSNEPAEASRWRLREAHVWVSQLAELDVPVIAAVDGPAYGAGFSLVLAADMVLATPAARFSMAFVRLGFVPDCGGAHLLPRAVGLQRAKELMYSGREVRVAEAKELGIVMEVHEREALLARAYEIAASFTAASRTGLGLTKRMLNTSFETDLRTALEMEAAAQGVAVSSDYARAAVAKAIAGEPPTFCWPART